MILQVGVGVQGCRVLGVCLLLDLFRAKIAILEGRSMRFMVSKPLFGRLQVVSIILAGTSEVPLRISMRSQDAQTGYNDPYEAPIDLQNTDFGAEKSLINKKLPVFLKQI